MKRIDVPVLEKPKEPGFVEWGERFFAYLVKEKSGTNPGLLELIYWLGDDGRGEVALSVFNFLRADLWKEFCRNRRTAKQNAEKGPLYGDKGLAMGSSGLRNNVGLNPRNRHQQELGERYVLAFAQSPRKRVCILGWASEDRTRYQPKNALHSQPRDSWVRSVIPRRIASSSRRRSTLPRARPVLLAMAMPIRPTCPLLSAAQRCA